MNGPFGEKSNNVVVLSSATVMAAGDILMHGAVKTSAENDEVESSTNSSGYRALFGDLSQEIKAADIAFANLETPISTTSLNGSKAFVFNAPSELLFALKDLGFKVLSVANNHMYDQGETGLEETLAALDQSAISYVGAGKTKEEARQPLIIEKNGIKIAFLGYTEFLNKNLNVDSATAPAVNVLDPTSLLIDIQKAREQADFVAVSIHWGAEYRPEAAQKTTALAHQLFEAGADIILGHHPHILQPLEVYKAKDQRVCAVIYSLGNFISNQSRNYVYNVAPDDMGDTRDGALLHFAVEKRDYGHRVIRTELAGVYYYPIWTENNALDRKEGKPPCIRVISLARAIRRVREDLARLTGEGGGKKEFSPADAARYLELSRTLEALGKRRQRILERLGEDYAR